MSSVLGLNAAFELVERLRTTVREFDEQQRRLQQNWRSEVNAQTRLFDRAAQERAAELGRQIAAARADEGTTPIQARFERRETQITEAFRRARKKALESVEQLEGRQKYHLQKRALEAERQRDHDSDAATRNLEEFRARLAESEARFAELERSAHTALAASADWRRMLQSEQPVSNTETAADPDRLLSELVQLEVSTRESIARFQRILPLQVFRLIPLWLACGVVAMAYGVVTFAYPSAVGRWLTPPQVTMAAAGLIALLGVSFFVSKRLGHPRAQTVAEHLARARLWLSLARDRAEARHRSDQERIQEQWNRTRQETDEQWQQTLEEVARVRTDRPRQLQSRQERAHQTNARLRQRAVNQCEAQVKSRTAAAEEMARASEQAAAAARDAELGEIEKTFRAQQMRLAEEWRARIQPLWDSLESANRASETLFPSWTDPFWSRWKPGDGFPKVVRFGQLHVDLDRLADLKASNPEVSWPGPRRFTIPLLLEFPDRGSLLLETGKTGASEALGALNNLLFRLLAMAAPGRVSFTLIDPVGLGQSFAGLMHLADYEETQINGRIWTQPEQIEEKLGELNEHMEKVIQMYLRNEYRTIAEYNAQAGSIAERYHVLAIAGFPVNFSETAARRLMNIAASGARCGVYTLIQWDQRHELPHDFLPDDFRKAHTRLSATDAGFAFAQPLPGTHVVLDPPPPPPVATEFLRQVGRSAKNSTRVELPFAQVAPPSGALWSRDTAEELWIPIGQAGAGKLQHLMLGKGTRQHALVAGKTGSGKSTLFHVIITNTALWCSPDQVEFYLVDFKKGVEFKCYANRRLPHARVVAIESDREFGLSVLQRVDQELRRRGDLFRKADVQELAAFRRARPNLPLPRLLLIIDEFQEFFTEEDRIAQSASVLLDRIVRQGRAFGIHVLLGSQTLGGAYTLARATMGQMAVRIALQCNEADAYLIMDESNPAPRLLSRPGEGIYNDLSGALEGNSPFQTAWLPDIVRDTHLEQLRAQADLRPEPSPGPMIFEGNAPADPHGNAALQAALTTEPQTVPVAPCVWLGAPNSIKDSTQVAFRSQAGSNLLVVGQAEEAELGIPCLALAALAAQYPEGKVELVLCESTIPGTPARAFVDRLIQVLPHPVLRPSRVELPGVLGRLAADVRQKGESNSAAPERATFLIVAGLQGFRQLLADDDYSLSAADSASAATSFSTLLSDGPPHGCHVIVSIDTYNNVSRFLGRKGLSEFQARVLFQMSPNDSASLIDSPEASKLGLYRALLHDEREGYTEKFRPYALMGTEWTEELEAALRKRG